MTARELTTYLHEQIPMSAAMKLSVVEASSDRVRVRAPLAPNRNHQATAFGGSLSNLAILAAWTWLHQFTQESGHSAAIVIQREDMQFLEPANGAIEATCQAPDPEACERFLQTLTRYRRARLKLTSSVVCEEREVGRFEGAFVALEAPPPQF